MCYAYSKPLYGDEFGNIVKFMEMTFYDFTEALGHGKLPIQAIDASRIP